MARYERKKGGNKTELSGVPYRKEELEEVYDLYIDLGGHGIHERNPKIHVLAEKLNRDVRSVENQLLGFKNIDSGTGRVNVNKHIKTIWEEKHKITVLKNLNETEKVGESKITFDEFKFRISSQLKTILGKNLITDDFIAVFELVKNSFDAHAKKVKIIFEKDKLTVWDDGKGMDRRDIIDKWLFLAYSAKNEGTEDIEFQDDKNISYRDRINPKRSYAGQKGIGRLGCDRIGSRLEMTTRKIGSTDYWNLKFNWDEYEANALDEFGDIEIEYSNSKSTKHQNFEHGLILEISILRDVWPRKKIIELKRSLAKLINPFTIDNEFNIEIISKRDVEIDNRTLQKEDYKESDIVNGEIKNFVFDSLNISTTQIYVNVSHDEQFIETKLMDRGNLIYEIREPNKFKYIPGNSNIQLFYLNQPAKASFTKIMGVRPFEFGSIFLFNNGFRVLPIGEPNNDPFNINQRKSQGHSRYLGTRELIGQVSISKNTEQFRETSSRAGGLVDSAGTAELSEFFIETLKKMESYVAPILWKISKRSGDSEEILDLTAKNQVVDFIEKISGRKDVELISYSDRLLDYITENVEIDNGRLFDKLRMIAEKAGDKEGLKIIDLQEKKSEAERKRTAEAERRAAEEERKRVEAEEKAVEEERRRIEAENARLIAEKEVSIRNEQLTRIKASETVEYKDLRDSNHIIGVYSDDISKKILWLKRKLDKSENISKSVLGEFMQEISLVNEKISTLTRFTTKSNYLKAILETTENIVQYIVTYIRDIYHALYKIEIQIINEELSFEMKFQPIEVSVLLDNIFANSRNKNASKIIVEFKILNNSNLQINIRDVGEPLSNKIVNSSMMFDEGVTSTRGAGLGLNHVKRIIEDDLGGRIDYNENYQEGFELIITLKNEN